MVEESEKVIPIHDRPELPSPLKVVLGNKGLHDKLHKGSGQPGGGNQMPTILSSQLSCPA